MDGDKGHEEELPGSIPSLFERLAQIPGYTWDRSVEPFRSSYDCWHVAGSRHARTRPEGNPPHKDGSTEGSAPPLLRTTTSKVNLREQDPASSGTTSTPPALETVLARVSTHILRLEREYHLCRSLLETSDPDGKHILQPLELIELPSSSSGSRGTIIVSISRDPGPNYLRQLGHSALAVNGCVVPRSSSSSGSRSPTEQVSLLLFLDFAIGASECLEILHHGQRMVHGELRGDAFHFNRETGVVKLVNYGSGARSYEHGLTSVGWSTLSKEIGVMEKLQFIAPEQTGRMPAAPDSRTDLYGLGVLFWVLLAGEPAFEGQTPMEIVQSVLSKRIPPISSRRFDIPDVISTIIEKMTSKQIDRRYHSASGLKYDLCELQRILGDGDTEALKSFNIATKDVSSYFNLPKVMVGRQKEHDTIVGIIEKVSSLYTSERPRSDGIHGMSSQSSTSDNRAEIVHGQEESSEDSRSEGTRTSRVHSDSTIPQSAIHSGSRELLHGHSAGAGASTSSPSYRSRPLSQAPSSVDPAGVFSTWYTSDSRGGSSQETASLPRKSTHKHRRAGKCQVISIAGAAGLGKSCLVQSVQTVARRYGYLATAKFDTARKQPFEPVLKAMSSLFRQIFSEGDVTTEFHQLVRAYVAPVSSVLHYMLDIPQDLIGESVNSSAAQTSASHSSSHGTTKMTKPRSGYGETSSPIASSNPVFSSHAPAEFLKGSSSSMSSRASSTFLDILRMLARHTFICLCFDDLQFADEESLELISSIVASKIPLLVIVTYREKEMLGEKVRAVLESQNAKLTKIQLEPLTEEDIINYVAATLYRPRDYVTPLAAVLEEKSGGNPFLLREVLDTCHRKSCVWFDWKTSSWVYDLDRVFRVFESDSSGEYLNNDFIVRRLNELSASARMILAWASLLGSTFSLGLVQKLVSGEFAYEPVTKDRQRPVSRGSQTNPSTDAVGGLQTALQACILVPGDDDDQFRFAHDRYMQASAALRECLNTTEMHYVIAQTMMKYRGLDDRDLYTRSEHVCKSIDIIKARVDSRGRFRELLLQAAQQAIESGARPTALYYYRHCQMLLQPEPWKDGRDTSYGETLQIYTRLAECWWNVGNVNEALDALNTTFKYARSSVDKAPSWVLHSRILSQSGDTPGAFRALKLCLGSLGMEFEAETSWERCDAHFHQLCDKIQGMDRTTLLEKPASQEPTVIAMGAVLIEIVSSAFWTDPLAFYQLALQTVELHWNVGAYPQISLAYEYLSVIATGRFSMITFGAELNEIADLLLARWQDESTSTRAGITYWYASGHFHHHVRDALSALEVVLRRHLIGDRQLALIDIAVIALNKLYASDPLSETEMLCAQSLVDFPHIKSDMRGGPLLLGVRQVARALQGKTRTESPITVLSDDQHDSEAYVASISSSSSPDRALDHYYSLALLPLYLYEHYDAVIDLGESRAQTIEYLWSLRSTRMFSFYLALSYLAVLRRNPTDPKRHEILDKVRTLMGRIKDWEVINNVNYAAWSGLLKAELSDVTDDTGSAMRDYDMVLVHAQQHGFVLEEALTYELSAGFYLRRGAKRAALVIVREAITAYKRIDAHGKASQVAEKYAWLLQEYRETRVAEAACQTDFQGDIGSDQLRRLPVDENERRITQDEGEQSRQDRTSDWVGPEAEVGKNTAPGLGIDVIDFQNIWNTSTLTNSELQIDKLLLKMCEIILDGNSADFAAIILDEEGVGWSVMATGDQENGIKAYDPGLPLAGPDLEDKIAKRAALYSLRFRESVLLQNVLTDERFSNVSDGYLARNPLGKAVIALPILHGGKSLLGAIYLEGPPSTFTDRHLTVLQLMTVGLGISITNALLFKQVRKVSAANASMIESQKRALAQAREAEVKAKRAEAEAIRSLRLKEEAAKAKSIFLANVSHELRTPLNGMIGNSELLKATHMTSEQESYADSIRVCADTLLTVINDILDYSKLEAGKMQLVQVPFNIQEAIQSVVQALSCVHAERQLQTIAELNLPDTLVLGDPIRLHQILMNLLSNSYKFTPSGKVTVRARTEYETAQYVKIVCSVSDTGIGISGEQLKRLFTPFSQADDSTARKYGGSGLGLSICKSLIQVMGGRIWMDSKPGSGTTVTFSMTLQKAPKGAAVVNNQISAKDPDPESPDRVKRADQGPKFIDLSQIPREEIRICIAEDNPINQKIAISFVERLGFRVDAYENGRETVQALRKKAEEGQPYHLVLMDVQMPEMDGYEATREIRGDELQAIREVLIIAMTASAIKGDREKCIEAGMNNYLAKPVRANVLKTMLETYLQQPEKKIPDLEKEAKEVARSVLNNVEKEKEKPPAAAAAAAEEDRASETSAKTTPGTPKAITGSNALAIRGRDMNGQLDDPGGTQGGVTETGGTERSTDSDKTTTKTTS